MNDLDELIAALREVAGVNPLDVTCGECGSKPGKRCYGNGEMRRTHSSRASKAEHALRAVAADALEAATRERDAALAALERVRAEANAYAKQPDVMEPCGAVAQSILLALDGAPEPEEVEWGAALVADPSEATAHADKEAALKNIKGWNESSARIKRMGRHTSGPAMLVRRRKAGPWLPVEGEKP